MKQKFKVVFEGSSCFGSIEILNRKNKSAYVSWTVFDKKNNLVASFTNNYFLGKEDCSDEEIFSLIKDRILTYRIGRQKIFSDIEFED